MHVLVIGASGYVGRKLCLCLASRHEVSGTYRSLKMPISGCQQVFQVDIRSADEVKLLWQRVQPEAVFHLAYDWDDLQGSIVHGTRNLLQSWQELGSASRFIFISTGSVFSGQQGNYSEEDEPWPNTEYGRAKRTAEQEVMAAGGEVLRIALVYGHNPFDPQTRILIEGLKTGRFQYPYFIDEVRCPIHVDDLAACLTEYLELSDQGLRIMHLAGPQKLTRYQLAQTLAQALGYNPACIPWARLTESGLVRPRDLTMDTGFARSLLKTTIRTVEESFYAEA